MIKVTFSAEYSERSDDELLRLASDRSSLTNEAAAALDDELRRRNLTAPDRPVASVDRGQSADGYRISPILRTLKFSGTLLINLLVAVIGTAIIDTEVRRAFPTHTVSAIVWKEIILSVVCAAFIGFFMWRTWRSAAAKWVWVLPALWFFVGYLTISGSPNVWGRLWGFSSGSVLAAPDARTFVAFTVPLIRAISYSVGASISSLIYRPTVAPSDGC